MNAYSHKQFVGFEDTEQIQEAEDFLEKAGNPTLPLFGFFFQSVPNDYCTRLLSK